MCMQYVPLVFDYFVARCDAFNLKFMYRLSNRNHKTYHVFPLTFKVLWKANVRYRESRLLTEAREAKRIVLYWRSFFRSSILIFKKTEKLSVTVPLRQYAHPADGIGCVFLHFFPSHPFSCLFIILLFLCQRTRISCGINHLLSDGAKLLCQPVGW